MIVKLVKEWMGRGPGMFFDLGDIKANDLISRGIAEASTKEQAKASLDKHVKMQRDFRDKMLKTEAPVVDKEPDKEPEKPPEKKVELKIRQPAANK